jgi:hypothetical protein
MNPGTAISYNSNSLQTVNILTSDIDHHSHPEFVANVMGLAHTNGSALPYSNYPKKIIPIEGKLISSSTLTSLDQLEDTFKGYLTARNANLDIGYAGSTRRYKCIAVTKVAIQRPQELWTSKFSVEFTCQPFGTDTNASTLLSVSGRTAASYSDSITLAGTAPFQLPITTITYTAVGGSPVAGTVSLGNAGTGQQIYITRTWTTGDVLVIDSTTFTVTVNGVAVNATGAFPAFFVGSGTLFYSDTFATRTFTISSVYYKNYV